MHRTIRLFMAAALLALAALPAAAQQIKQPRPKNPDDEGLHYVLLREFAKVNEQLAEMAKRVGTLEAELARIKEQAGAVATDARATQNTVRDTDRNLTQKLVDTDQKLVTLRNDVIQLRSDLANLMDLLRRQSQMAPLAAPEVLQEPVGYITEMRGFHDRVHAAQRQRNQCAGHAFTGMEDLVGIRAGESTAGLVLNRHLGGFCDINQAFENERMIGRAVGDARATAEFHHAMLRGGNSGRVSGVRDI